MAGLPPTGIGFVFATPLIFRPKRRKLVSFGALRSVSVSRISNLSRISSFELRISRGRQGPGELASFDISSPRCFEFPVAGLPPTQIWVRLARPPVPAPRAFLPWGPLADDRPGAGAYASLGNRPSLSPLSATLKSIHLCSSYIISRLPRPSSKKPPSCHCEQRSDAAISRAANHGLSTAKYADHAKTECLATEVSESTEKTVGRALPAAFQPKQKDSHTEPQRSSGRMGNLLPMLILSSFIDARAANSRYLLIRLRHGKPSIEHFLLMKPVRKPCDVGICITGLLLL